MRDINQLIIEMSRLETDKARHEWIKALPPDELECWRAYMLAGIEEFTEILVERVRHGIAWIDPGLLQCKRFQESNLT